MREQSLLTPRTDTKCLLSGINSMSLKTTNCTTTTSSSSNSNCNNIINMDNNERTTTTSTTATATAIATTKTSSTFCESSSISSLSKLDNENIISLSSLTSSSSLSISSSSSPSNNGVVGNVESLLSIQQDQQLTMEQQQQQQQQQQNNLNEQGNQNAVVLSTEEALLKLCNRTKYPIVQENGQRCYGPPPEWQGPAPERGCEVFVGKIPRDCFEDELVPLFEVAGPIYMFRLMMDFNGCNRGYGFCMYTSRDHAKLAVQKLDNYEIRNDKVLGVCQSVDNCRLFVGGIPKTKTKEEIFVEMNKVTEGVRDVIVYPSAADKTKNRGFAFVEYESHKAAAMARRKLIPGRIQLWGQLIAVDWAEPEREVDETIMSSVRVLYVRNLMLTTTEETLRDLFNEACEYSDAIERVKKLRDYAFIHFRERKQADLAMRKIHNTEIEGSRVEVSWAKPVDKSESNNNRSTSNNKPTSKSPIATQYQTNPIVTMPIYFDSMFYNGFYPNQNNSPVTPLNLNMNISSQPSSGVGNSSANRTLSNNRSNRVYRNAAGSRSAGGGGGGGGGGGNGGNNGNSSSGGGGGGGNRTHNSNNNQKEKKPAEILEEVCQKNNWGMPNFSFTTQEVMDSITGQQITLYLGQVAIGALNQYYMAPIMSLSPEEAKQAVAKSVLILFNMQLQVQTLDTGVMSMPCQNNASVYYPSMNPQAAAVSLTTPGVGGNYYSTDCGNVSPYYCMGNGSVNSTHLNNMTASTAQPLLSSQSALPLQTSYQTNLSNTIGSVGCPPPPSTPPSSSNVSSMSIKSLTGNNNGGGINNYLPTSNTTSKSSSNCPHFGSNNGNGGLSNMNNMMMTSSRNVGAGGDSCQYTVQSNNCADSANVQQYYMNQVNYQTAAMSLLQQPIGGNNMDSSPMYYDASMGMMNNYMVQPNDIYSNGYAIQPQPQVQP